MKLIIDTDAATLQQFAAGSQNTYPLFSKEAFELLSLQWVRVGWSLRYYHNFSWCGHPILQLPEDLLRLQEVIFQVRPKVIIETGVYQGGSLLFHATLLNTIGGGKVIGIDRTIAPQLRESIAAHPLGSMIELFEADSTSPEIVTQVQRSIPPDAPVLVILDSGHSKAHVAQELECYAPLVTPGSYIIATDGIMADLHDVPGGQPEWKSDNPQTAANEFAARHPEFQQAQPKWLFHDGPITENVTYWPGAWMRCR